MDLPSTKTTWLVGAGISKDAGYPLVSDFFNPNYYERMLKLSRYDGAIKNRLLPRFEKFSKEGRDLNSLMAYYLATGDTESSHELNALILLTLDEVRWANSEDYNIPYIHAFADQLGASESSVLTFNYDTLVEELITFLYIDFYAEHGDSEPVPYNLGFDPRDLLNVKDDFLLPSFGAGFLSTQPPTRGRLKLLKLHGSTCLRYCTVCRGVSYVIPPSFPSQSLFYGVLPRFTALCSRCNKATEVALLFVPPASDEQFPTWELLNRLWGEARKELHSSDILVIAGYSLPDDDKRARKLLEEAVRAKPALRVLVVDPVADENFRQRFSTIFPHAVFLRRTFKGLMATLMTLRTADGASRLEDVEGEARELLAASVAPSAARIDGELPGTIPLAQSLDDCFDTDDMNWDHRMKAVKLLGLSPAFQQVIAQTALMGSDDHLRGICAEALGGYANQEAVDVLARLVHFTDEIQLHRSPQMEFAFILPHSIATFALSGLRDAIATAPGLNYRGVAAELAKAARKMMETDQIRAASTYQFLKAMAPKGQVSSPSGSGRSLRRLFRAFFGKIRIKR